MYEWEDKYKKCQSVDKLKKKLSQLMQEYLWSVAIECEKTIEEAQKEKRKIIKQKEALETKVTTADDNYKQSNDNYEQMRQLIDDVNKKVKELQQKRDQHLNLYKEQHQNYKTVNNELKKYESQCDRKKHERKQLCEKLEEEKQKNQKDYQDEKRQIESKIQTIKQKISDLQAQEKNKHNETQMFQKEIDLNNKIDQERKFDLTNIEKKIDNLKLEIKNLLNSKNNQIHQFGDYMAAICDDVKIEYKNGRFKQMPRGPIGMYIEPVKYEWSLAIEQCIGNLVNSFICANYDDERLMHQIIARHARNPNSRPRVIVNDFNSQLYDVKHYRPSLTQYSTVYEMLIIKDSIVANALIDQRKIESVLLLPDRETGREVMERNIPKNCVEAFLPNGDQLYCLPSFRAYACQKKQPSIFIKNVQSSIEYVFFLLL